jgi:hypothetical protein
MKMANLPNKYIKVLAGAKNGSSNGSIATRNEVRAGGKSFPESPIPPIIKQVKLWNRQ